MKAFPASICERRKMSSGSGPCYNDRNSKRLLQQNLTKRRRVCRRSMVSQVINHHRGETLSTEGGSGGEVTQTGNQSIGEISTEERNYGSVSRTGRDNCISYWWWWFQDFKRFRITNLAVNEIVQLLRTCWGNQFSNKADSQTDEFLLNGPV